MVLGRLWPTAPGTTFIPAESLQFSTGAVDGPISRIHVRGLRGCTNGAHMAQAETVIYEPPHSGLPYLVVTLTPNGVTAIPVKSNTDARVMISQGRERRHPSDRQKPSPVTPVVSPI